MGGMALLGFFEKLRPYKTVLRRTRPRHELPADLLYIEWLAGEGKRKLMDIAGKEHVIADKLLESNYKLSTGSTAKKLIKEHWLAAKATPQ